MNPTHLLTILRRAKKHNLGITTLYVLTLLGEETQLPMHIITARLNISSAALTGTIDRMETISLVTRTHGRADRRTIFIALSEKGRKTLAAILREPTAQPASSTSHPALATSH